MPGYILKGELVNIIMHFYDLYKCWSLYKNNIKKD